MKAAFFFFGGLYNSRSRLQRRIRKVAALILREAILEPAFFKEEELVKKHD